MQYNVLYCCTDITNAFLVSTTRCILLNVIFHQMEHRYDYQCHALFKYCVARKHINICYIYMLYMDPGRFTPFVVHPRTVHPFIHFFFHPHGWFTSRMIHPSHGFTPGRFTPRMFHPPDVSPHGRFTPRTFHPPQCSPPEMFTPSEYL